MPTILDAIAEADVRVHGRETAMPRFHYGLTPVSERPPPSAELCDPSITGILTSGPGSLLSRPVSCVPFGVCAVAR